MERSFRELTRRRFLQWAGWSGLVFAGLVALWNYARFLIPNVADDLRAARRIGRPADFPVGRKTLLADALVFVIRDAEGFWAVSARCTHLGCATNAVDWGFVCPCHGSKFDPRGGVLVGPATVALPWYKLALAPDGALVLDLRVQVAPGTVLKV